MGRCNLHTHLCCGPPGECPVLGEHPVFDEQGEKLNEPGLNLENVNNNNSLQVNYSSHPQNG